MCHERYLWLLRFGTARRSGCRGSGHVEVANCARRLCLRMFVNLHGRAGSLFALKSPLKVDMQRSYEIRTRMSWSLNAGMTRQPVVSPSIQDDLLGRSPLLETHYRAALADMPSSFSPKRGRRSKLSRSAQMSDVTNLPRFISSVTLLLIPPRR
jgi:hypothetical protein